jgi:hypothetical protein
MRRRLMIAVLIALVFGAIDHRGSRVRATAGVYSFVDIPYQGQNVAAGALYVAGWALDCATGTTPTYGWISVWSHDTQSWLAAGTTPYAGGYRPDVTAAMSSTCPGMSDYTGHAMYLFPTLAPGSYRLWVRWADSTMTYIDSKPVDVTVY